MEQRPISPISNDQFDGRSEHIQSVNYSLESNKQPIGSYKHQKNDSIFKSLQNASLSVSMLAKPSDDRNVSTLLAGWNVVNLIQGPGILGIPYAVQQGGWTSVAMMFIVAILSCHTGKLIIDCMYETSKKTGIRRRVRASYPEVAEGVLGKKGFVFISTIQVVEMFGAVVMCIVLLGTVWNDLLGNFTFLGMKELTAISCCIILPTLFITRMSLVSWFSMISVFSLCFSLITLIVFCFTQTSEWSISNIPTFNLQTFPIGFGMILFSYTAHPIFPSIEGSMKEPEKFNSMMNSSFFLSAMVKVCLGTCMVLTFGMGTMEVATSNLKEHLIFFRIATCEIICTVLLLVPLIMFVVSLTFDDALLKHFPHLNRDSKYHWFWLLITRSLLLSLALFLAIMVPHFGLLMGVIGSLTGTCLCFIFPSLFHLKLRWETISKFEVFTDFFIIGFGLICGSLGLIFSLKALFYKY